MYFTEIFSLEQKKVKASFVLHMQNLKSSWAHGRQPAKFYLGQLCLVSSSVGVRSLVCLCFVYSLITVFFTEGVEPDAYLENCSIMSDILLIR